MVDLQGTLGSALNCWTATFFPFLSFAPATRWRGVLANAPIDFFGPLAFLDKNIRRYKIMQVVGWITVRSPISLNLPSCTGNIENGISCSALTTKTHLLIINVCNAASSTWKFLSILHLLLFHFSGQRYCVDATKESDKLGRLINHSRLHPNCAVKVIPIDGVPRLALFAKTEIPPGNLLTDRKKLSIHTNTGMHLRGICLRQLSHRTNTNKID